MKKIWILLFLLGVACLISACDVEDWQPTLEPGWPVATAQNVYVVVEPTLMPTPWGNYIIVQVGATGQIGGQGVIATLVLNNNTVCSWNFNEDLPWDREDTLLYFTPDSDNCPDLDARNGVIWHVQDNYGVLRFEESGTWKDIEEIPVWSLVGTVYQLMPRQ